MLSFLSTLFLVAIAELGDKTQLLALSLATKHKASRVLAGILIAILGLQLLAVSAGQILSNVVPMDYLKVAIGLSFIGFGAWMLKNEDDHEAEAKDAKKSAIAIMMTVATTFFIAELGDKTQLATVSLAAKYNSFFGVWLGSAFGLFLADCLAVTVGVYAGKKLPQDKIRYISAAIFILFGIITLVEALI